MTLAFQPLKQFFFLLIAFIMQSIFALSASAQCTTGCNQTATTNVMPGTNNFTNTFCITTGTTLTYNQNFDMNGGTTCVGPNVSFASGGGNWVNNWTVNNYGSFSRGISLSSGQVFNNYGTFTGSVSLNGGTIVNYNGATFTPSSFNFNGGSFTNNAGGTATFSSSVTVNSGAVFTNNGTMTTSGLTLNSSATATLGGTVTINGSVTNNGIVNIAGLITVTGNYNQNSSGTMASQTGSQCNALNVTGYIQGQGNYNGSNGLLLNKILSSPACTTCLTNGASTTPPGQPVNQITGAILSAAANNINGTITNPGGSPAATHYIVLRRFGTAVSDQPVNYINYAVGNRIGNSMVVAVNAISSSTFTDVNVIAANGCGTYHYAVFPYNASGSCGTYNNTINATNRSSIAVTSTAGTVGTSAVICSGSTSGTLTLTGYVGSVVRWESSVSPFSTWSAISNTSNTYTSGTLTQTTQFRAVVNAGTSCSNVNSVAATITLDNIAPSITCPGSQTINLDGSCAATLPSYTSMATVSDNCTPVGSITITQSPVAGTALSGAGSQIITLTATDAAGNLANCTFTLSKLDVTPPVMTCPANITTTSTAGICGAVVNYTVNATDNCSGSACAPPAITGYTLLGTLNGHTYFRSTASTNWATANTNAIALGAHLVTITSAAENTFLSTAGVSWAGLSDQAAEGTWVWVTGEPVSFTSWNSGEPNNSGGSENYLHINYSVNGGWNDISGTGSYPAIIEFDCVTTNMVAGYASGAVFPVGTTTVTYNATDAAGNTSANCNFTVTVNDITPPTISCPANINVTAAAGACDAVITYTTPVASDNCGSCSTAPAITGYTSLGVYNGSAYYISTTAATCTAAFTAASSIGATIATIGSASENTFVRNAATAASFTGSYLIGQNDVTTEGTFVGFSGEPLSYTNWNAGEPNNSGNEDYTQVLSNGLWNDIGATASMNYIIKISCISPVRTSGFASGSTFPIGTSTINYSASDPSGNTSVCSFTVTVSLNTTSTNKTVTALNTSLCGGGSSVVTVALSDVGVNYQLRDASNTNIGSPVAGTGGTISLPTGTLNTTTTFNVLATNAGSGCSFSLTNTVTITVVADVTAPLISCLNNITVMAAGGACTAAVNYNTPTVTDNCTSCTSAPAIAGFTSLGVYNGTAYYVSTTIATITAATAAATAAGGQLASVTSAGENAFIRNAVTASAVGTASYWIGYNDLVADGTWAWPTCETPTYTNWNTGEPNGSTSENNLQVYANGTWNDLSGANVLNYVMEVSCNTITPVRTAGLASGSNFPVGVTTVSYAATDAAGNIGNRSFTVTVNLNASSLNRTVTPVASTVCAGSGTNIGVYLTDIGISYQLRNNATNANVGSPLTGTGGTIYLPTGNLFASTTFNVYATGSSCNYQLTNMATVTVNTAATVTPGATLSTCQSSTPSAISLTGASVGGSATTGAWSITSGGGTLSSTAQTATPSTVTYTPAANYSGSVTLTLTTNAPGAPCVAVAATRTITVGALPTNIAPTAPATVCSGSGTNIQIASSQLGVNYQLRNNTGNVNIGSPVPGTGGSINLPTGNLTVNTTFNVLATNGTSGCSNQMTSTVTVSINALPADKTPAAVASTVCSGTSTTIQIASSQTGVNYQLRNNAGNVNIGSAVAGTGLAAPITLPTGAISGNTTFNVLATLTSTSCSVQMLSTVTVSVNATGQWIGSATGDWNTAGNWCGGIPTSTTNVNIPAGTTVNIQSANAVANSVSIAGTASLVMTGSYSLNISAGGNFSNSGTFTATASTGSVIFLGAGTISGTTTFKNIDTYGALDFGTASTVSGTFSLQSGGSVTGHSPTYVCPSSILLYKPGSTFIRGLEWTSSSSGAGYPANVVVQNNTTVDFPAVGDGYVCNDLTIDNGSGLLQNYAGGSASLRVGRNITITGTLSLGSASGGDIYVGGNWTRNAGGVFNANDRKVTFDGPSNFSGNGTSMSTITAPASAAKDNEGGFGGENFAHLWVNKTNATDSVVLLSNITVTRELGLTKGTFSLRNSDVTMVSNKTRTADIAPVAIANVAVRYGGNGRFVIQRFIQNPTAVRSWRLLGAPLQAASAPSLNAAYQEGVVNPDRLNPNGSGGIYNPWPGYGTHITGPGGAYSATDGFDHGTGSSSILYANAGVSTWISPASTTSVKVTDKQGWMLFVRGDRGFTIGNQYMPSQSTTLEPKGKIYIGDVALPVTAAKQVIANPYASAISLLNVDVAGTLGKNSTYYMWDPRMFTSYTQPGKWVTFTGTGNSFVQTTSASAYPSNGVIESGQAFVVDAVSAGNITFHETDKLSLTSSLVGIANGTSARPAAVIPMFRSDIYANNSGVYTLTDAVLNIFDDSYNNNADAEDAKKVITFNTKESLSILRDTSKLAIEKRRNIQVYDTIYYTMSRFNEIPYRFRFAANNFAPGMEAFLEDKFTNNRTALSTTDTSVVDFTITAEPLSKAEDRFRVVFKAPFGNVLPVTFTKIKAAPLGKNIAVEWIVANELNMKEYEVQKSVDGNHFEKANTSISQGNYTGSHAYNWLDEHATAGINYYRIAGKSINGTVQYSQVVKVNMDKKGSINVYPNPVTDGVIRLAFEDMDKGNYALRLLNTAGQVVMALNVNHAGGNAIKDITAGRSFAKGIYNLEVNKPGKEKMLVKVIIE